MSAAEDGGAASRSPDLALARLHLRLGSLALARAELETLAGRDALDEDGLVDLAEARWRTGDITGAGEAASAALDDEDGPLLALVVAAEAAAARGRPTEARRLADRAMEVAAGSIDVLFAGMPRAGVWPPDAAAPPPSPTTMFDPPRRTSWVVHRHPSPSEEGARGARLAGTDRSPVAPRGDADAGTISLWEAMAASDEATLAPDRTPDLTAHVEAGTEAGAEAGVETEGAGDLPTGDAELDLGRAALEAGDTAEAAVRLGLVLRVAPALAPAVLDLVQGRTEREIALVRGDAFRLVGREIEARRAFIDAARGGSASPPPEQRPDSAEVPAPPHTDLPAEPSAHPSMDPPPDATTEGDPA